MLSTSHDQIFKHPTNTSPSKHQFSFPKSSRFPSVPKAYPPHSNSWVQYDNSPSHLSKITFSIGRGQRSDFTRTANRENPGPTDYKEQPGIGGLKNMAWKSVAPRGLSEIPKMEAITYPGPGAYESFERVSIGSVGQKYTMRAKPRSTLPRYGTPGPGAYSPKEELNGIGRYFNSKYHSTGAGPIPQASDRANISARIPGPGAYDPKTALSSTGEYFLTSLRNAQSRSFGKAVRRGFPDVKLGRS